MFIPGAQDVEVYIGGRGHICIKQDKLAEEQHSHDDTHHVVVLLPEQVEKVIAALKRQLEICRTAPDSKFRG